MKILHTSDIHLSSPNDERYKALEYILNNPKFDLAFMSNKHLPIINIPEEIRKNRIKEMPEHSGYRSG